MAGELVAFLQTQLEANDAQIGLFINKLRETRKVLSARRG